jgi:hypothetical protein
MHHGDCLHNRDGRLFETDERIRLPLRRLCVESL